MYNGFSVTYTCFLDFQLHYHNTKWKSRHVARGFTVRFYCLGWLRIWVWTNQRKDNWMTVEIVWKEFGLVKQSGYAMEHGTVRHKMCDIISPHNFWILSLPFHFWLSFCRYFWLKTTAGGSSVYSQKQVPLEDRHPRCCLWQKNDGKWWSDHSDPWMSMMFSKNGDPKVGKLGTLKVSEASSRNRRWFGCKQHPIVWPRCRPRA